MKSIMAACAECRSSIAITSGRCDAMASRNSRHALKDSVCSTPSFLVSARPTRGTVATRSTRPRGLLDQRGKARRELGACGAGVVGLEDAGLRLDDLPERPERDALAVREATPVSPDRHQLGLIVEVREQLSDDAALAHAPAPEQRDELHGWLSSRARERVLEEVELVAPAHERGRKPRWSSAPKRLQAALATQTRCASALPLTCTGSSGS